MPARFGSKNSQAMERVSGEGGGRERGESETDNEGPQHNPLVTTAESQINTCSTRIVLVSITSVAAPIV